jgi:two-component system, LuxR family, sensor kinase FixL
MISSLATREFNALLDVAVDAVVIIDHRGVIEAFNRAAERLFGYSSTEAIGANVSLLMPEPDRSRHDDYLKRYLASGDSHVIGIGREVDARRKDGSTFPVALAVGRIPDADPPRFVGFLHDLTSRQQAAEERQRIQQRMRRVSHLATLGEMAGAIAHEINQPLTAISNFAVASERLLAAPEPDLGEIRDALRQIAGQAMRAGEIIRRIRELVRSRETRREPDDINGLIREVWALTHADARLHGVRLSLQLAEELPAVVVDGIQIQQVLLNLIHNGIEALMGDPGGEREVIVGSHRSGKGEIEISVMDSGPGVDPSLAGRIFEPFCTTKEQGTGLGLAISRTIVEAHRGRLEFRPNFPHGACFIMTLPCDREVAQ